MKRNTISLAMLCLGLAAAASCASDDDVPLYGQVLEKRTLEVGGGGEEQTVTLGTKNPVTLVVPGNVAPTRVMVQVSLVTDTAKRGRSPVNDSGVLVEPQGLSFAAPVRVRQFVSPPPVGRGYVAVVVPDNATSFVVKSRARLLAPATTESGGLELWEGDGTGSGLWGLAVSEAGDPEEPIGTPTADAGTFNDEWPDAASTSTPATRADAM
ncbi:MAG: hypothetical protein SF187_22125 [Deltaproteobacteria bacterium]|nr:hypothetical protein [Deltaproteobacteria bacterium]